MSDSEILVKAENVSKKFCRSLKKSLWYGVQDMATEVMGGKGSHETLREGEFWAVNDVSFELKRGECLGLIGRNGAGKTTLLKMLNGLIKPDHGRIEMRGRVGALIALGAGFNPILTGRENIYVNGSVLGLTKKEIDAKMEEIIDFADIREFIDSPVQSYSSGMQVRLGFAVATAMKPDVLILDEILAVGDQNFQIKCLNRVGEHLKSAAVIFVGHQMERVAQICNSTLVLDRGRTAFAGEVTRGIEEYNRLGTEFKEPKTILGKGIHHSSIIPHKSKIAYGEDYGMEIGFESEREVECVVRLVFLTAKDEILAEWSSFTHGIRYATTEGTNRISCKVVQVLLRAGTYRVNVVVQPVGSSEYLIAAKDCIIMEVEHERHGWYPVQF